MMTFQDTNLPTGLLARVKAQMSDMSRADLKVAQKLLDDPNAFAVASVRSIASDISVSEPTVVRFCRTVGCDGFKDLKFRLTRELAFEQARNDAASAQVSNVCATGDALTAEPVGSVGHLHAQARQALDACLASTLESTSLDDAAALIAKARKIAIYGIGGSSAILAEEVHNRLFRLGLASVCYTDSYAQRMSAASLGDDDVALFVTSTGRPRSLQDSLELAKYYGAKTVAIADRDTPVGRDADICINVRLSQAGVHELQPNPMRFAQLLAIDLLALKVAEEMGPEAKRILRQTRASIASLHGIAPQQPIGD